MTNAQRILVNTSAQYLRTIINLFLSFYSTRLILLLLGESDFGIYSLIAGVVSMLSFVTNGLVVTTQRYLSFHQEQKDIELLRNIFSNSLILHVAIGFILVLLLEIAGYFMLNGFLEIPVERHAAAVHVFHFVVASLFITFVTAPYKALTIAHENIVYSSVVDVVDGVLKVAMAIFLSFISVDYLVYYALLLSAISLLNFFAYRIYCKSKYKESTNVALKRLNKKYLKNLTSFAGWSIYSLGCIIGRTQGVAIIINKYFGTILNAAYGIAQTVNGGMMFIAASICNAMNPQIAKAEGIGDRIKMLRLSEIESKFCTLLLCVFAIPSIFEMDVLLCLWLKEVPDMTVYLCRMILVISIVDQLTIGLGAANQAIGNIRDYSLVINTVKILTLPAILLAFFFSIDIQILMILYLLFELICCLSRLVFLKLSAGLSIIHFCKTVFLKEIIPIAVILVVCYTIHRYLDMNYRFIITYFASLLFFVPSSYFFGLCADEKQAVNGALFSIVRKYKK